MTRRASTSTLPASGGGLIRRTTLPGGLRVITEAMPGVRSASVGIWIPVGSRDESHAVAGASHFLEHLLFKGTTTRSALDIASTMDAIGGEFNAFTEKEHTCFYATVLDGDLPTAVEIVADVVLHATVLPTDVEVERAVVLEEIAMRDDDPSDLVHDLFAEALFGDTPLGRPILGTSDTVTGLSRNRINGFYRRRYRPEEMVVAVAGNIDHQRVVRLIRRHFESRFEQSLDGNTRRRATNPSFVPSLPVRVVSEDTEQANIVLGMRSIDRHDERRFVLGVLSAALGGGMSSRLFQQVREERGLAYSVYSFTSSYSDAGVFGGYAGCQPGKAEEVISIMRGIMAEVAARGLTETEVRRAKGQLCGSMVLGLEDSGSRMMRVGKAELSFGDVLGLDQLLEQIDAVTRSAVNELATEILSRPGCLTVVGPFGDRDFDAA
jgi:predicted Zn-dependent peptidase